MYFFRMFLLSWPDASLIITISRIKPPKTKKISVINFGANQIFRKLTTPAATNVKLNKTNKRVKKLPPLSCDFGFLCTTGFAFSLLILHNLIFYLYLSLQLVLFLKQYLLTFVQTFLLASIKVLYQLVNQYKHLML